VGVELFDELVSWSLGLEFWLGAAGVAAACGGFATAAGVSVPAEVVVGVALVALALALAGASTVRTTWTTHAPFSSVEPTAQGAKFGGAAVTGAFVVV
jgi:hypothetical protein